MLTFLLTLIAFVHTHNYGQKARPRVLLRTHVGPFHTNIRSRLAL